MNEATNIHWYNEHASDYCQNTIHDDMSWPYADFLSALAEKPAQILDLGCGSGRDLLYFKNKGYDVEGLDGSRELCKFAKKFSRSNVIQQKFSQLQLTPDKYDGIFANAVLMHVETQDRHHFLNQIYCALRPNGIFYAHYPKGSDKQTADDGRILHLSEEWIDLCKEFSWTLELEEGRPPFFSPEEQTWKVIRFRKN